LSEQKLTVAASIRESYHFLAGHMPHFLRLIYGPLMLWVGIRVAEQVLIRNYDFHLHGNYLLDPVTAAFAIVWYRQFLLGSRYASYRQLLKTGFSGNRLSLIRFGRTMLRIIIVSLILLVPTLIISIGMMIYYQEQGMIFSDDLIQLLAIKSTFVVMMIFSPILVRLSLYTAGFALGRSSVSFRDIWRRTRGYTVTLWWVALRGFLPLGIYSYIVTSLLKNLAVTLSVNYILSTIIIEMLTGFLTFMMLAIVVAANAEAFRILIGVRDGDAPHRQQATRPNKHAQLCPAIDKRTVQPVE